MRWLSTEERLAIRLIEYYKLDPPVDIESLLARYADVHSVPFPVDVDGVTIGLKQPRCRPRVYIDDKLPKTRKRFTLAHELGHILIPSHVGSIVDELDTEGSNEEPRYWEMEAEANRFAAEILMPTSWAKHLIGTPDAMGPRVSVLAQDAAVSVEAAALKALRVGPPGFILAKSDGKQVVWSSRTDGTQANPPLQGGLAYRDAVSQIVSFSTNQTSNGAYLWWRIAETVTVPSMPKEEWRAILARIIESVDPPNPLKVSQSLNGIISAANSSIREDRTLEKVYAACLHRVQNRQDANPYVTAALAHRDFATYLLAKVYTLKI